MVTDGFAIFEIRFAIQWQFRNAFFAIYYIM